MFEIQHYGSFIAAIVLFQIVPGAGTISILNATARNGIPAGLAAVAGTLCGDCVFMVAAVAGLATIMAANPLIFQGVQWCGVGYLFYIGIQLLKSEIAGNEECRLLTRPSTYFRRAFTVSLTNPKVVLFFVSFFPLFIRQDAPGSTLVVMMLHVTGISCIYQAGLVLIGNRVAAGLRGIPAARRVATQVAGIALMGFGIKLAGHTR